MASIQKGLHPWRKLKSSKRVCWRAAGHGPSHQIIRLLGAPISCDFSSGKWVFNHWSLGVYPIFGQTRGAHGKEFLLPQGFRDCILVVQPPWEAGDLSFCDSWWLKILHFGMASEDPLHRGGSAALKFVQHPTIFNPSHNSHQMYQDYPSPVPPRGLSIFPKRWASCARRWILTYWVGISSLKWRRSNGAQKRHKK